MHSADISAGNTNMVASIACVGAGFRCQLHFGRLLFLLVGWWVGGLVGCLVAWFAAFLLSCPPACLLALPWLGLAWLGLPLCLGSCLVAWSLGCLAAWCFCTTTCFQDQLDRIHEIA